MAGFVRSIGLAALAGAMAIMAATNAQASGALTVGVVQNENGGISFGWAANYASDGEAKYDALLSCITVKDLPAEVLAACRLVTVFKNQCVALAWESPLTAAVRWGWAINANQSAAETAALANCGGQTSCAIKLSTCDTTGPNVAAAAPASPQVGMFTQAPAQGSGGGMQPGKKH